METPARSDSERPPRRGVAFVAAIAVTLVALGGAATVPPGQLSPSTPRKRPLPALERHAGAMREGLAALAEGDAARAQQRFSSFSYGERPIEQARLHGLARAQEMRFETAAARRTLEQLRARGAMIAARDEALLKLAALSAEAGLWAQDADALADVRASARTSANARRAAEAELTARLALGDPGAILARARGLAAGFPSDAGAANALAVAAALTAAPQPLDALTTEQKIDRAWELARRGDVAGAMAELDALGPAHEHRHRAALARAFTLQRSGRHDDAMRLVRTVPVDDEQLRADALEIAALSASGKLAGAEASSWRSWTAKERIGTRRVKVKGRWTTRTLYRTVTKKARRTDARTRRALAAARSDATVALERLLAVQQEPAQRRATLKELATIAHAASDRDAMEARIAALVAIDPREDHLLQEEWNDAWSAWRAKKIAVARERFGMIQRTYALPAARRQARYWYARSLERSGEPQEARRIFDELASVGRDDVYAIFARERGGAPGDPAATAPPLPALLAIDPPAELALAWELAQLGLGAEARAEVRAAQNDGNRRWVYAILAESHARDGSQLLMANALRRGFPEIGTVDDALVPERYRRMYYDAPHRELLERNAAKQGLDPALVLGLVLQESSGDAAAGSKAGATGLMQLMPSTAKEVSRKAGVAFHEDRLTEPELNVELGTRYLRELLGIMKGDEVLALASYNAGIGNVQRWLRASRGAPDDEFLESIPYAETRGYVKRVLYYRSVYREGSAGS